MKFKTDFIAEDYSELCWFQARSVSMILAMLLALALGFTFLGLLNNIIISIVLVIIGFPIIMKIQKNSVIKRAGRRYGAFGASSELYLEIDNDEIRQTAASGETRLAWSDVYEVSESKNCYYVFLTKRKAFYFPKRSFESDEQKNKFFEYIEKYVPEKKIKIKR